MIRGNDCQPYTALFDIGRSNIDGRSVNNYLEWLKKTIEIFPNLMVFHDGSCDLIDFRSVNLIKISKDELETFGLRERVVQILNSFKPISPGDITFKLVDYSLVQYAKFELAEKALEISQSSSILWVDAGISRFISSEEKSRFNSNVTKLLNTKTRMVLEIDLRNNFQLQNLTIQPSIVGSCRRVISGTSFWINSDFTLELNYLIKAKLQDWIEAGVWDNEQVLLRNISPLKENILYIPQIYQRTGSVARKILTQDLVFRPWLNHIIEISLERGNLALR
jgi:hypothetical protein